VTARVAGRRWFFVTHPQVVVDPALPVPRWTLSERGRARMRAGLGQPWLREVGSIHCSTERKALDAAAIWAEPLGLPLTPHADLGENDRSSTGYLPADEFERTADAFFAQPEASVRGWECAVDAQRRIVAAVNRIDREDDSPGVVAIVAHGAVGTLLYCDLAGQPISRRWDQPANGGGNWYAFTLMPRAACSHWQPIDAEPAQ
jgi:broad specificity phosphatase PhoE